MPDRTELSERDTAMLAFEEQLAYPGGKEACIREQFGMHQARYYLILNALLNEPAALAYNPMLVNRLRARREERLMNRAQRRLA